MTTLNTTPQSVQEMTHLYDNHDEIDLLELWTILVKHKMTIFTVTAVTVLLAISYALLVTPIYKIEASLLPATEEQLEHLRVDSVDSVDSVGSKNVFEIFNRNLASQQSYRKVFDDMGLVSIYEPDANNTDSVFSKFSKDIVITRPKIKKDESRVLTTAISIEGQDSTLTAEIVNQIVATASDATKLELISNLTARIDNRKKSLIRNMGLLKNKETKLNQDEITRLLETDKLQQDKINDEISVLRHSAKARRYDSIAKLKEAANIANTLGLLEISDAESVSSVNSSSNIVTKIENTQQPLYLRGEKALRSEVQQLESRKSDDPFIPELRQLQKQLSLLDHNRKVELLQARKSNDAFISELRGLEVSLEKLSLIELDANAISVMRVDQQAYAPESPVKPKKILIVAVSLVLGLMFGIFTAFFKNATASRKEDSLSH